MQEVTSVELVLENCESITLSPKQIGNFWLSDVTSQIERVAYNSISKQLWCKEAYVELSSKSVEQRYTSFGRKSEQTIFERLRICDIMSIEVTYEDGTKDYVLVPWNEENEYCNKYQTNYIDTYGNLCILISKDRHVESLHSENNGNIMDHIV